MKCRQGEFDIFVTIVLSLSPLTNIKTNKNAESVHRLFFLCFRGDRDRRRFRLSRSELSELEGDRFRSLDRRREDDFRSLPRDGGDRLLPRSLDRLRDRFLDFRELRPLRPPRLLGLSSSEP